MQARAAFPFVTEDAAPTAEREAGRILGVEGTAAHRYFSAFGEMLRIAGNGFGAFGFRHRNRRPPRDPVNALSLAHAMLVREWTVVAQPVGLDPYLGFHHQPRYGRPALALDLMEEFRPLVGDSSCSRS